MTYLFYNWWFVPFNPLHLFHPSPDSCFPLIWYWASILNYLHYLNHQKQCRTCLGISFAGCSDTALSGPCALRAYDLSFHVLCIWFSSVQLLSCVRFFVTPWAAACQASLSITNSQSLLKLISIELVMPSTISSSVVRFSSCPQSFPASGLFQGVSSSHQVATVLKLQNQSFQWIFRTDFL